MVAIVLGQDIWGKRDRRSILSGISKGQKLRVVIARVLRIFRPIMLFSDTKVMLQFIKELDRETESCFEERRDVFVS